MATLPLFSAGSAKLEGGAGAVAGLQSYTLNRVGNMRGSRFSPCVVWLYAYATLLEVSSGPLSMCTCHPEAAFPINVTAVYKKAARHAGSAVQR